MKRVKSFAEQLFFLGTTILLMVSCNKLVIFENGQKDYIYVSHVRTNETDPDSAVPQIEQIDFKKWDLVLLGGDMLINSSENTTNLDYLQTLFDIGSDQTLWSVGNHDVINRGLLEQYTGRPGYYTYHDHGITFIVLDTEIDANHIIGDQLDFFNSIMDTLTFSKHLVVLHHKLIWMVGNEELESQIGTVSNADIGNCLWCLSENNFYQDLYPRLEEVHLNGVNVVCMAGDLGKKVQEFCYTTPEGIIFMGCGINNEQKNNKVILLHNDLDSGAFSWEFAPLKKVVRKS